MMIGRAYLTDFLQGRDKVVITHDGQSQKHVERLTEWKQQGMVSEGTHSLALCVCVCLFLHL